MTCDEIQRALAEITELLEARHQETMQLVQKYFDALIVRESRRLDEPPAKPMKRYTPRSPLYRLAQRTFRAVLEEDRRVPTVHEIIEVMSVYDSDHHRVFEKFDGKRIQWRDYDGRCRSTTFRAFKNGLKLIRAEMVTVSDEAE